MLKVTVNSGDRMPKVTIEGVRCAFRSAIANETCDFIDKFINNPSKGTLPITGLIFGLGDVILEYWSCVELWYFFRYSTNPEGQNVFNGNDFELYRYFTSIFQYKKDTGGAKIPARSNVFIAFSGQDDLRIEGDYVLRDEYKSGHGMYARFNNKVPKRRFNFYLRFVRFSKYPIERSDTQSLVRGIEKDIPGSTTGLTADPKFNASNITSIRQFLIRRACKFLMYDEILERHGKIHYALDGIDSRAVANKTALSIPDRAILAPKVPVCTSELRELFRVWNFFKEHTHFYRDLKEVAPIWITDNVEEKKLWADYAQKLCYKCLMRQQTNAIVIKNMELLVGNYKSGNYDNVLTLYHGIPWQLLEPGHTAIPNASVDI